MAKKDEMISLPGGKSIPVASIIQRDDVQSILRKPDLSPKDKRRAIAELIGLKKPKKIYATPAERKAAAAARAEKRRKKNNDIWKKIGIAPQKREKMSPEQKKARRSEKAKDKRALFADMVKRDPDKAAKFGFRFNTETGKIERLK